jgi:uncharacterized protein (TIGR02118 family)
MVKLISLNKRKPGISRDEFNRRWTHEHAALASRLSGLKGYRLNLTIGPTSGADPSEPLYDGVAELWWDSVEAMEAAFADEIGRMAIADGDEFFKARLNIYAEEHVIIPGP